MRIDKTDIKIMENTINSMANWKFKITVEKKYEWVWMNLRKCELITDKNEVKELWLYYWLRETYEFLKAFRKWIDMAFYIYN